MANPGFYLYCLSFFYLIAIGLSNNDEHPPVIKEHPSSVIAKRNDPMTLNCATQYATQIIWFKDGQRINLQDPNDSGRKILLNGCSLFFLRVITNKRETDAGTYWFEAVNRYGKEKSKNATLLVASIGDAFFEPPHPLIKARVGDPLTLHCRPPKGVPEPRVFWKHDGRFIGNSSRQFTTPEGDLVFEEVFNNDAGEYICVAENVAGARESQPSTVTVMRAPYFEMKPQNQSTIAGTTVIFECIAVGKPLPSVTWRKLDGDLPRERTAYSEGKPLQLKDVTFSDSGTYVCEARNEAGFSKATSVLKVVAAPSVIEKPNDLLSLEGKDIELTCRVDAESEPLIAWKLPFHGRDSLFIKSQDSNERVSVSVDGTTLRVKRLRVNDSGTYQCWGISTGGGVSSSAEVVVVDALPPPTIGVLPGDHLITPGSSVTFPCQVVSEAAEPTISWWFQKAAHLTAQQVLPVKNFISVMETGALTLKKVSEKDAGIYTCKVSSESGDVEAEGLLKISEDARNVRPIHEPVPAPPSKPKVVSLNKTSIYLSWSPNSRMSAGGDESYTVEHWKSPWQEWRVSQTEVRTTSSIISELSPNTAYVFLVKAVNRHGESFPSPWSDVVYTHAPPIGGRLSAEDERILKRKLNKPIVVLMSAILSSSTPNIVNLSWEVLENSEIEVDGVIIYSIGSDNQIRSSTVLGISASFHIVKDLIPNTRYTFFVVPFWRTFEGVPSNAKIVITPEQAPTEAPKGLKTEVYGPNARLIRWMPLDGLVTGYRVSISNNNVTNIKDTKDSWFEAKDLIEGRFYTVKVAATNSGGTGPWSSPKLIDLLETSILNKDTRASENGTPSVMYAPPHPIWLLYLLVPFLVVVLILALMFILKRAKNKSSASTLESSSTRGPAYYASSETPAFRSVNMYGDHQKLWRPILDSDQDSSLSSAKLLHPEHLANEYAEPRITHSSGPYMMTALLETSSPRFTDTSWRRVAAQCPEENIPINWTDFLPPPPSCPPPTNLPAHHPSLERGTDSCTSANTSDCSGGDRRHYNTNGSSQYENTGECDSEQQYEKPCDMKGFCSDIGSEHPYAVYTPLCRQNFQSFSSMNSQQPLQKVRIDLHPSRELEPPKSNTH